MAILLVFIISEGGLLEINSLPVVHRQSQKYDYFTDIVQRNYLNFNLKEICEKQMEKRPRERPIPGAKRVRVSQCVGPGVV